MLGGDKREQEIARLAAATGAQVRAHGFPWPEGGIPGVGYLDDPGAVLAGGEIRPVSDSRHLRERRAGFAPSAPSPDRADAQNARRHDPTGPHHPGLGRPEPKPMPTRSASPFTNTSGIAD